MHQGDPLVGLLFVLAHFHILCYFVGVFPLCLFLTLALPMLFPLFLCFPIGLCGVIYSTPQVSTWASFVFPLGFVPPIEFCCPYDIKILGMPFGFASFFFFGRISKWRCLACKHVLKIRGHLSGFWYPLSMFRSNAFLFVSLLSPLQTFRNQLCFLLDPNGNFW